jgi:hypothetical protein
MRQSLSPRIAASEPMNDPERGDVGCGLNSAMRLQSPPCIDRQREQPKKARQKQSHEQKGDATAIRAFRYSFSDDHVRRLSRSSIPSAKIARKLVNER